MSGAFDHQERTTFALFPYLRTSKPVSIGGANFRSTEDTTGLSVKQAEELTNAVRIFYLQDDVRVQKCTYAAIPYVDINHPEAFVPFEKLRHVVAYLYAVPHLPRDEIFLALEHATLFLLSPSRFVESLARPFRRPGSSEDHQEFVDGFEGTCNLRHYIWVVPDSRLYPPIPRLRVGGRQDMAYDFESILAESPELWTLLRALTDEPSELSQRVLAAVRWFNRGCSLNAEDEPALLSLAIAFETLLALPEGESTSERFREAVLTLLGRYPKLDDWLMQFYRARSGIVHSGRARFLRYLTGGKKKEGLSQEYLSFLSYGRVVFRLCVSALLFTSARVEAAGLAEKLVTNQQRFEEICRLLNDESVAPIERFAAARARIVAVTDHRWAYETGMRLETLVGVVKAASRALLGSGIELNAEVTKTLRATADAIRSEDHLDELTAIHDLERVSRTAFWRAQPAEEPIGLTWAIIEAVRDYTGMHYIQLRYSRDTANPPEVDKPT